MRQTPLNLRGSNGGDMTNQSVTTSAVSETSIAPKPQEGTGGHPTSTQGTDGAFRQISETLTSAIERMFKLGSWGLVLLFIGTLLMICSFCIAAAKIERWTDMTAGSPQAIVFATFCIGAIIVVPSLVYASWKVFSERREVRARLSENSAMIDAIQGMAIKAAEGTFNLQSLLLVNAEHVGEVLVAAAPVLKLFGVEDLGNQSNLNAQIVQTLLKTRNIVDKAKTALIAADPSPLAEYTEDLASLNRTVVEAMQKPRPRFEELKAAIDVNVDRMKQGVEDFCSCLGTVNSQVLNAVEVVSWLGSLRLVRPLLSERGLDSMSENSERLKKILALTSAANTHLRAAVKDGKTAELEMALESIRELKAFVGTPDEGVPPAQGHDGP